MAFMEPEYYHGHFTLVQSVKCGDEWLIPSQYLMADEDLIAKEEIFGYGVRLSASGYMDCTEWDVYDTEAKAIERANSLMEDSE